MKEYGSNFPLEQRDSYVSASKENPFTCANKFRLAVSGRSALASLVAYGIETYQWKSIYLPQYFCHEVDDFLEELPIIIHYYEVNPFLSEHQKLDIEDSKFNVIVNVDFFGIYKLSLNLFKSIYIIDDITYSINSFNKSTAHYCFGSLRKELPLPLGGFVYSPQNLPLPCFKYTQFSEDIETLKIEAMTLKHFFLGGDNTIEKDVFRNFYTKTEIALSSQDIQAALPTISLNILKKLNIDKIFKEKKRNIEFAIKNLNLNSKVSYNNGFSKGFGLVLFCDRKSTRDLIRAALIKNKIFPSVLWPKQIHPKSDLISSKMLFVHLDYRHSFLDIKYITTIINKILDNV